MIVLMAINKNKVTKKYQKLKSKEENKLWRKLKIELLTISEKNVDFINKYNIGYK
jgi:very-short-patch-repair endonuclease